MDQFQLTILLQTLDKSLSVISRLEGIVYLTKLSGYIKSHKIKDDKILNIYKKASQILLGVKNNG